MGVRFPSVQSNTFIGPLPANATETIVCTTPPLTPPLDSAAILIIWFWTYLSGTGNNGCICRVRRGATLTGTFIGVNTWSQSFTSGNNVSMSGFYFDSPGAVTGVQYSLTVVQANATAAGTIPDVAMLAFAL